MRLETHFGSLDRQVADVLHVDDPKARRPLGNLAWEQGLVVHGVRVIDAVVVAVIRQVHVQFSEMAASLGQVGQEAQVERLVMQQHQRAKAAAVCAEKAGEIIRLDLPAVDEFEMDEVLGQQGEHAIIHHRGRFNDEVVEARQLRYGMRDSLDHDAVLMVRLRLPLLAAGLFLQVAQRRDLEVGEAQLGELREGLCLMDARHALHGGNASADESSTPLPALEECRERLVVRPVRAGRSRL